MTEISTVALYSLRLFLFATPAFPTYPTLFDAIRQMCQDSLDHVTYSDLMIEEKFDDDLYKYLCDNHCHPQDDVDKLDEIAKLRTGHLTLMGVREQDWDTVKKVVDESSIDDKDGIEKCIPSFGKM